MSRDEHPVWEVYDLYRTSRLNVKYFSELLHRTERKNFVLELILLCSAPTSTVAGLWFWETDIGHEVWKYFGVIAAFSAVIKPLLSLPKKMKEYGYLLSGYRTLEHDLQEIKSSIAHKKNYDKVAYADYNNAMKRKGVLVGKDPDAKENMKIKQKCEKEVLSELPSDAFYVPEE